MEGTDIASHKDDTINHDHTYYGNGCPNEWGSEGAGGSSSSCSSNVTQTYDGETQKIGTYYTFQAATSGSGGQDVYSMNTNAIATFCPLGWQLPYSGTGGDYYDQSKSLKYLINSYNTTSAAVIKSYPFSYILGGFINFQTGLLYTRDLYAYYYYNTLYSGNYAYTYSYGMGQIAETVAMTKYYGMALRCFYHFSIQSSTARWQEILQI